MIKTGAICATLFFAGTIDARGWRSNFGAGDNAPSSSSGRFNRFKDRFGAGDNAPSSSSGRFDRFSERFGADDVPDNAPRRGGRPGRPGRPDRPGRSVLETIEDCREEITLTCALDLNFDLDTLTDQLEERMEIKEEARAERQLEREERHAKVVEACPERVDFCGLPLKVPYPEEGEEPDFEAVRAFKEARKCVMDTPVAEVQDDACAAVLEELHEEKEQRQQDRENGEFPERPAKDEELQAMLKDVRRCLREQVKPALELQLEESACSEALERPHAHGKPAGEVVDFIADGSFSELASTFDQSFGK